VPDGLKNGGLEVGTSVGAMLDHLKLLPATVPLGLAELDISLQNAYEPTPFKTVDGLPAIVIVLVELVPEAVAPAPTKFSVVAEVDKVVPSSCTVIPFIPCVALT
jgi:hypothetical protein